MPSPGSGLSLGRLFGIEVRIEWSWLLIFLLVTVNVGTALPQLNPSWGSGLVVGLALLASLLFFLSVLAHELAHSLVARARGLEVRSITLWLFGGVSNITREPPSAGAEFLIAVVGPLTSVGLGLLFLLLANASVGDLRHPLGRLHGIAPLTAVFLWLAPVNVILGLFNLIPGFPLDGGRIVRSALWAATGSLDRATRWASWLGDAIGWLLIAAGVMMAFGYSLPFFGSGFAGGLWLAFIGWFLHNAARASLEQAAINHILEGVPVTRLMRTDVPTVQADTTVAALVHERMLREDDRAFAVLDGAELVGLVCLEDVRRLERDEWARTPVRRVMTPRAELAVATPLEDASDAFTELATRDVNQLPVLRDGQLVGMIRRGDILRWLQLHRERVRS